MHGHGAPRHGLILAPRPHVPARVTPYELICEPFERTTFPAIRAEAEERGSDPRRRDQFLLLGHVGATLREIVPDDAAADALDEFADLLYQAFQFWSYGRRLYAFDRDVMEALTAPERDLGAWELAAPPACYLQLPSQLIWARVSAESPYEPVDGCFVVVDETEPRPEAGAHLRALLVLGLRTERPGVSLVSYRTDLDPREAGALARSPWREEGTSFANTIPGGERAGFHTLATTSELLALVLRALHYLDRHPRALLAEPGSAAPGETHIPYTRVTLGA